MIYLASPYSHHDALVRHERYILTLAYTHVCLRRGEIVFSPIVYGHQFAEMGLAGTDFRFWQSFNDSMVLRSTAVRVLKIAGWDQSVGVEHEMLLAKTHEIPITFEQPQGLTE